MINENDIGSINDNNNNNNKDKRVTMVIMLETIKTKVMLKLKK